MNILLSAILTALLASAAVAAPSVDFDGLNNRVTPVSNPGCYGLCGDDDPQIDPPPPPPSQPQQPPIPVTPPHTNPPPPPPVTPQPYYPPPPPPSQPLDFNFYFNTVFPLGVCAWEGEASSKECPKKNGEEAQLMLVRSAAKDMLMDEGARRFSLRYKYPLSYYEATKMALSLYQHSLDGVKLMLSEEVGENRSDPHFEWMSPAHYAQNLRLMMENEKLIREWKKSANEEALAGNGWKDVGNNTLELQCGPACEKLKRELLGKDVFGPGLRRSPFGAGR